MIRKKLGQYSAKLVHRLDYLIESILGFLFGLHADSHTTTAVQMMMRAAVLVDEEKRVLNPLVVNTMDVEFNAEYAIEPQNGLRAVQSHRAANTGPAPAQQ